MRLAHSLDSNFIVGRRAYCNARATASDKVIIPYCLAIYVEASNNDPSGKASVVGFPRPDCGTPGAEGC